MKNVFNILGNIFFSFKEPRKTGLNQMFGPPAWSVLSNTPFGNYHSLVNAFCIS